MDRKCVSRREALPGAWPTMYSKKGGCLDGAARELSPNLHTKLRESLTTVCLLFYTKAGHLFRCSLLVLLVLACSLVTVAAIDYP